MNKTTLCLAAMFAVALLAITESAHASDRWARRQAARQSWHAGYYHTQYGQPVALVMPPTVKSQMHYSWGVGMTTRTPIWHQFSRPYPNPGGGRMLSPTPLWPSHTDQFGVYYVRGPWGQRR